MNNEMNKNSTISSEKNRVKPTSLLLNKAVLLILSSNFLGKTFVVNKQETVIGRQDTCDIVINDPLISKVHCRIIRDDDGKFYLEDMGS
ncbi:MAG: FHA domain-containing protein, partial [Spirochaetes bacterium]|nr:FHA domain-containing protein [Spirochaetota bacterium]